VRVAQISDIGAAGTKTHMNRQKKRRNHWVPQAYLRSFAADENRKKIWTFSKNAGDPALKPIEKVAVRFYLYAPRDPQGQRDYSFENKLASLEELFAPPFWDGIANGYPDLCSESIRKGISLLAAVMFLRNPRNLQVMHDMHRDLVNWYSQFPEIPEEVAVNGRLIRLDPGSWPAYRDGNEDDIKRMWLQQVGSAVWLANILMEMRWAVSVSEKPVFITTDNPVILLHKDLRFRGFKNSESSVVFPLSPTRVLFLDHRHSEPDGQYYAVKDTARSLNGLLWRDCNEHMFSPQHPDEVCAEMLRDAQSKGIAC
jgi:hypothetical protein